MPYSRDHIVEIVGSLEYVGSIMGIGGTVVTKEGGTTLINVLSGTLTNLSSGTFNAGTVVISALPSGGTLLNLASGTLAAVTTVSNLTNGTVQISYPSFNWRASAGTTTIKSSAGVIHNIVGTYAGNGTLYNSSGTSAAVIWGGAKTASDQIDFDVAFGSLTWAGTGASALTIIYA